ncbi:MAG: hypothetical protein LJE93_14545 [Acidobacteria bacterium]|jgi:hypothetical protein|nr:hypothetical protein [Acidobacteriota bacterium]
MPDNDPIRDIERRAWTLYFEDGLWDIFLGLTFLGGGLRSLTDNLWCYLLVAAGVLVFILGKLLVTAPRVGQIKYGPRRKARLNAVRVAGLAAMIFTAVILVMIVAGADVDRNVVGWIFVFVVSGVFLLMAYFMDFNRLYGYTVLIAAFMVITEIRGDPMAARAQIVAGLVPLTVGTILFARFLRDHPVVHQNAITEDGNHGRT